jgi:hypothetical protein
MNAEWVSRMCSSSPTLLNGFRLNLISRARFGISWVNLWSLRTSITSTFHEALNQTLSTFPKRFTVKKIVRVVTFVFH